MKRILKKYFIPSIIIVLAAVASATFVGCGKSDSGSSYNPNTVLDKYIVTIMDDGEVIEKENLYSNTGNRFPVPKKKGNKFLGFYTQDGICFFDENGYQTTFSIDRNLVLICKWEPLECEVHFYVDGGTLSDSEDSATYSYGDTLNLFPIPTKQGYDFKGWMSGDTLVTDEYGYVLLQYLTLNEDNYTFNGESDVYLTAVYEIKELTITFNYMDSNTQDAVYKVDYNSKVSSLTLLNTSIDTGSKELAGWSLVSYEVQSFTDTVFTEDVTFYAIWKEYVNVTLVITSTNTQTVKVYRGTDYTTVPTRDGYTFGGWYTTSWFSGLPVKSISYGNGYDTYYARWVEN